MALNLEISKSASTVVDTISSGDGVPQSQIREYYIDFALRRVTSGSYATDDLRMRLYPYHHFNILSSPVNQFYKFEQITSLTFPTGNIVFNAPLDGYQSWMNKARPPRIDEDTNEDVSMNFSSEILVQFTGSKTINVTNPNATSGSARMFGIYGNEKLGRYGDVEKSYSYIGSTSTIACPTNWLVEQRINAKTKTISSIVGSLNADGYTATVTVTTSTNHGYGSVGETFGATIVGSTEPSGIKYNGNYKATITALNKFTYTTFVPQGRTVGSYTTGSVEYWEVIDQELTISSIVGNGSGTITVNVGNSPTVNRHGLKVGDVFNITGTSSYNGTEFVVASVSTTSFTYVDVGNTAVASETGTVNYCARPASAAVGVNYPTGIVPKVGLDHTLFTKLIYANSDTSIWNPFNVDYRTSIIIPLSRDSTNKKKLLYNFPTTELAGLVGPFSAQFWAFLESGAGIGIGDTIIKMYQMSSSWSESGAYTYTALNPIIKDGDGKVDTDLIYTYYYDNYWSGSLNAEDKAYMKFDISSSRVESWVNGTNPFAFALVKDLDTPVDSTDYYFVSEDDNTSPRNEQYPFVVISANPSSDDTPPIINITDTKVYLNVTSIQGAAGVVSVTTLQPHGLSLGDTVNIFGTIDYNLAGATVLASGLGTYTFKYNLPGASTSLESGGFVQRTTIIDVSAEGVDETEMPDGTDPADIIIRKGVGLSDVAESNVVLSPNTVLSFDFVLNGLDNGYADLKVRDKAGNYSSLYTPPFIVNYYENSTNFGEFKSGDTGYIYGFNVDSYTSSMTLNIGDDTEFMGIISGGSNQTISSGSLDTVNNRFSFVFPTNTQGEYEIGTIDTVNDTIEILGADLALYDLIVFNAVGNLMQDPLKVGQWYVIISATPSVGGTVIQISDSIGGSAIDLTVTASVDMVAYNPLTPAYVIRDGYNTSDYNNVLFLKVDDYAPFIDIPTIIGTGVTINVTITDINPIDQTSVLFINGTQTATPVQDVNGDGRVLIYEVLVTGAGTFEVTAKDVVGNIANATENVPPVDTPFIQVTGYDFTDPNYAVILRVKVIDDNMPTGATDADYRASSNTDQGVFVESSTANSTYGYTADFETTVDGIEFNLYIDNISDGYMTIYARDEDDNNNNNITPPVLITVSPDCFRQGDTIQVTGINLDVSDNKYFFAADVTIDEAVTTMNYIEATVNSGADGSFDLKLIETIDSTDYPSNTITKIYDNTAPIITLIGDTIVELSQFDTYVELGATATDIIFGDVTENMIITGFVDTSVYGTYYITYSCDDGCGNIATLQRTVNVVTGCPIYIDVLEDTAKVGDIVTIQATVGLFNPTPFKNTVTFNGVVGQVISGTTTELKVIVPIGATTGFVQVETGADNPGYETCSLSNVDTLTIIYPDESFDTSVNQRDITSNSGILSIFGNNISRPAIYNRDMAYSNFSEVTDENSMVQNVYSIVLTRVGERLFNPTFGTRLENYIHKLVDNPADFEKDVLNEIIQVVSKYEPRATIIRDQSFVVYDPEINDVKVVLLIQVPTGNVQTIGITLNHLRNTDAI